MSITNLIQAQNVFAQNHFITRKINDKSISHTNTNNALRNDKKMSQTSQELQVSFKDLHPEADKLKVKKKIVAIGDSLIKNVSGRDVPSTSSWGINGRLIDHI